MDHSQTSKIQREKTVKEVLHTGEKMQMIAEASSENMETRKKWNITSKALGTNRQS